MPATTTVVELSDDMRELMRDIAGFTGAMLDGAESATGTAEIDEYARKLAILRAVWVAIETGTIPAEHLPDIARLERDERDWYMEDLALQRDHLQTFIVREDPGLRYHDDRSETIASYHDQIESHEQGLKRCEEFLATVAS